jgi:hypothetical protein
VRIINPLRFQAHGIRRKRFPDVVFARGRAKQISYSRDDKELNGRPTSLSFALALMPALLRLAIVPTIVPFGVAPGAPVNSASRPLAAQSA